MDRLIVGLGNPGKKYAKAKHNIGFLCLDAYAKANKLKFSKETKFMGEILIQGQTVFLKPKTFMNLSGNAVKAVRDFYQINIENILIISDDIDLPFAKIRLREKGGSGGHNGLKSIISQLGSENFNRLRIGIDRNEAVDAKDHVLSNFTKAEFKLLDEELIRYTQIIDEFSRGENYQNTMNKYN